MHFWGELKSIRGQSVGEDRAPCWPTTSRKAG